ncbi:unnamed protein product [Moneuplotes crassus]|uniref:Uncharacterized protein n=1 Tax=Euplotes crassus TaxID=5936 RepID=A0AAD1XCD6_EUPCR|nr:unnamed protein product [Moneuplotes crassus]
MEKRHKKFGFDPNLRYDEFEGRKTTTMKKVHTRAKYFNPKKEIEVPKKEVDKKQKLQRALKKLQINHDSEDEDSDDSHDTDLSQKSSPRASNTAPMKRKKPAKPKKSKVQKRLEKYEPHEEEEYNEEQIKFLCRGREGLLENLGKSDYLLNSNISKEELGLMALRQARGIGSKAAKKKKDREKEKKKRQKKEMKKTTLSTENPSEVAKKSRRIIDDSDDCDQNSVSSLTKLTEKVQKKDHRKCLKEANLNCPQTKHKPKIPKHKSSSTQPQEASPNLLPPKHPLKTPSSQTPLESPPKPSLNPTDPDPQISATEAPPNPTDPEPEADSQAGTKNKKKNRKKKSKKSSKPKPLPVLVLPEFSCMFCKRKCPEPMRYLKCKVCKECNFQAIKNERIYSSQVKCESSCVGKCRFCERDNIEIYHKDSCLICYWSNHIKYPISFEGTLHLDFSVEAKNKRKEAQKKQKLEEAKLRYQRIASMQKEIDIRERKAILKKNKKILHLKKLKKLDLI